MSFQRLKLAEKPGGLEPGFALLSDFMTSWPTGGACDGDGVGDGDADVGGADGGGGTERLASDQSSYIGRMSSIALTTRSSAPAASTSDRAISILLT